METVKTERLATGSQNQQTEQFDGNQLPNPEMQYPLDEVKGAVIEPEGESVPVQPTGRRHSTKILPSGYLQLRLYWVTEKLKLYQESENVSYYVP